MLQRVSRVTRFVWTITKLHPKFNVRIKCYLHKCTGICSIKKFSYTFIFCHIASRIVRGTVLKYQELCLQNQECCSHLGQCYNKSHEMTINWLDRSTRRTRSISWFVQILRVVQHIPLLSYQFLEALMFDSSRFGCEPLLQLEHWRYIKK